MVIKFTVFSLYNKRENNNTSKQVLLSVLGVAILIVAVVGISFAAFTYTQAGERENTISTGTITMTYTEGKNGISIDNAIPMDDTSGKALTGENNVFDFTVSATIKGKTAINYVVVAKKGDNCTINDEYIRLYLEEKTDGDSYTQVKAPTAFAITSDPKYGAEADTMELVSETFNNKSGTGAEQTFNKNYRLKMWVDKDYPLDGTSRTYSVKVNVYGTGQD